jgi:hypothetical protein
MPSATHTQKRAHKNSNHRQIEVGSYPERRRRMDCRTKALLEHVRRCGYCHSMGNGQWWYCAVAAVKILEVRERKTIFAQRVD